MSTNQTAERSATGPLHREERTRGRSFVAFGRDYAIVVSFVLLFAVLAISSPPFATTTNILNLLDQQSPILIIAATGTLVVIAGGIDLSIGATFALGAIVGSRVANESGVVAGVLAGLLAGLLVGVINGLLVTYGRIEPLIGTLATSFMVGGLAMIASGGSIIVVDDPAWRWIGTAEILGARVSIWLAVIVVAAAWILLEKTVFGRRIFATGGNEQAAWLSGVRTARLRVLLYTLSGTSAAFAGVIVASRVGSAQSSSGMALLFSVLAGIVIGGTSVMGGVGAVWRSCLGVLFLALIHNGFTLLQLDTTYEQVVSGLLIVLAVGMDAWARRR